MIDKKMTALLGSVLLIAAAMPLAMAHTGSSNGVAGNYYGPAGAYVDSDTVFPGTPIFVASMLCDMEVLGDGSAPSPLDEGDVDQDPSTGGLLPEGTFDDGGQGGACHTSAQYTYSPYNTAGCGGTAFADDAISDRAVWISASCDWEATSGGDSLSTCLVNEVISEPTTTGLATCVANFVNGGGGGTFAACGADGVADAGNFGTGTGVAFPSSGNVNGCNAGHESAAVFTFVAVDEAGPSVTLATAGQIWQ